MTLKTFIIIAAAMTAAAPALADVGLPDLNAYAGGAPGQDMAALQKRVTELMEQAKATKESADRLGNQLDRLINATGIRFGGEAIAHSIAFQVFPTKGVPFINGSALTAQRRAWPTVGYLDFKISAHPKPELSAEVVYRMEKIFGGYWGSLDLSGVRRFNIHGDTPIGFDLGDFNYRHTPLTVWAPEDEFPFEIEVLARRRREGMAQVYLGDNRWPLQGARVDATILLFNAIDLAIESIGVRTAIAGTKNTGLPFAVLFPYDQYLVGVTANLSAARWKHVTAGLSYLEMMESKDTSITPPTSPELRSNVVGGDLNLNFGDGKFVARAEAAVSNYTYDYAHTISWTVGSAAALELALKSGHVDMKAHVISVDEKFINYAAQTRTEIGYKDFTGSLPTGNNLLDPHTGTYGLSSAPNLYFSRYNPVIFATNIGHPGVGLQPGGVYIPGDFLGRALPYGLATPNRVGGGGDLGFSFAKGGVRPRVLGGVYAEPVAAYYVPAVTVGQRGYLRGGAGLTLDLGKFSPIPVSIGGGWLMENVKAIQPKTVDYTYNLGDFNVDWQAFKTVHVILGWEQAALYGVDYEFAYPGDTAPAAVKADNVVTTTAGGIYWSFSKTTDFYLNYTHTDLWLPSGAASFGSEEFESKLAMRF